jgi:hypothetical protein
MADILRIKRRVSGGPGAPASLANAELAYNEVDHSLYYGEGTGGAGGTASVIRLIAGDGLGSVASPAMNGTAAAGSSASFSRGDHIHPTDTSRAPTASPTLTGTVTMTGATSVLAPTVTPAGDSSTKVATTAFVQSAIGAVSSGVTNIAVTNGLSGGGSGAVTIGISANGIVNASLGTMAAHTYKGNNTGSTATPIDVTAAQLMTDLGAAPLNSPSFTGTPTTAASPANRDNTLKLATTAYVLTTRIDQLQPPNVDVPWNSKRITGLLDPSASQDAATKSYVDGLIQGIDAKSSVRVATTTNLAALSGLIAVDGITVAGGDRVLVKDQTTQSANGIYVAAAGAWARATDADVWAELPSAFVFVEGGTVNLDSGWLCTVDAGGTIGTTAVTWVQFSGAGQVIAGNGLTKTGNQLDVVGTASRISVAADSIDIDVGYVGQGSITTLGTVASGTWNATTIGVAKGGSGATTFTAGYLKASGTSAFTTSATIPSTDITGLGTMAAQNASAVAISGGTIDGVTFDFGTF